MWCCARRQNGDEGAAPTGLFRYGPNSAKSFALWKIEPCGKGLWTITNCKSKKCLCHMGSLADDVRQATFRKGALEQEWRLEEVSPTSIAGDSRNASRPGGETQTAEQSPALPITTADKPPQSPGPKPTVKHDAEMDEARLKAHQFAMDYFATKVPAWFAFNPGWGGSPASDTIIVRDGNRFRVRGWISAHAESGKPHQPTRIDYACELLLDRICAYGVRSAWKKCSGSGAVPG